MGFNSAFKGLICIVTELWAGIPWSSNHSRSKTFLSLPKGPNRPWGPPKRLLNAHDLPFPRGQSGRVGEVIISI